MFFYTILGCNNDNIDLSTRDVLKKVNNTVNSNIVDNVVYYSNGKIKYKYKVFKTDTLCYIKYNEEGIVTDEYLSIDIVPKNDTIIVGDNYESDIYIYGYTETKNVTIVPFLFGVDSASSKVKNINHYIYSSPIINKTGVYRFQVNIFIDSTFYTEQRNVSVID